MLVLLLFLVVLLTCFNTSSAIDTLNQGHVMNISETLVSAEGMFELGFFNPGNFDNFYLGIWYKKSSNQVERVPAWLGNREQPVVIDRSGINSTSSSCFVTINEDGNIVILDGKGVSIPVTSISLSEVNTSATLLDSGNLILREINSGSVLWQSFEHPTDTFLVGMKLGYNWKTGTNLTFRSWKSLNDPMPGAYSLFLDPARTKQVFITKGSQKHWTSGQWNGKYFQSIPEMVVSGVQNSFISNENESYFMISAPNTSIVTRLVLDVSGKAKQYTWSNDAQKWIAFWEQPRQQCDIYAYCGAFSFCDPRSLNCQCLQGYEPYSLQHWNSQDWSGGCVRKNNTWKCRDEEDGFMLMSNVTLPINFEILEAKSTQDCKLACWNNCSCRAYAVSSGLCQVWHSELLNIKPADYGGGDLFLRVPNSQILQNSRRKMKKKKNIALILAVSTILPFMLVFTSIACFIWKRKLKMNKGEKEIRNQQQDLLAFDFSTKPKDTRRTTLSSSPTALLHGETWDVDMPLFSLESVSAATDNFSDEKKLGQGGFGPVYKGTLLNGQEVAIKRLSRGSQQGWEELKNEITLIAKLQHKNLVKLLGCCIEGEEKILIYEYMPNKSLDLFLFDPTNRVKLNWERRVHIIEGIAQGLLYLHQYSRLRIIHRDLKASNILLDDEMNPKISDFGMARIFGGNMSQANTMRIVGTYGYMSPEYAMQGIFSIKSDVFSFGVLLLEILSGRKNTSFYLSDTSPLNLIGHAWNLWRSQRELEFMDPLVVGNSSSTPLRYIHVALLCVQEKAVDRPTMSEIIAMLNSELINLPSPNQPAFSTGNSMEGSSSIEKSVASSANDVTISMMTAR